MLGYLAANVVETLLRVLPFPGRTGLIKIGDPGRNSPVFLTCNFHLTVARVKRALKGMDCFLLVANSRGINVWCGAAGGHFTDHDVISVLLTSGIGELVDHRRVILPQLAAAGIESKVVAQKSGWQVIWGPVYAGDIPVFVENKFHKTAEMREVNFPLLPRLEMAIAWAFPISLVLDVIVVFFWRAALLPLTLLVWTMSFLTFLAFPLYRRWLDPHGKKVGFVFFDFGRGGFQLIVWAVFMLGLVVSSMFNGAFSWGLVLRWGLVSFAAILMISIDLMGSTPVFKSGLHPDNQMVIALDRQKCRGAGDCQRVCPRNCFKVAEITTIPGLRNCVQCGACIVQCPHDALSFRNPKGEIIPPETVRKFKLNLLGSRSKR